MSKKGWTVFISLFLVMICMLGYLGYKTTATKMAEEDVFKNFDWIVPMSKNIYVISHLENGYYDVYSTDDKNTYYDEKGNKVDYTEDVLHTMEKEDLWGYQNSEDEWVIDPIYGYADDFNGDYAIVALEKNKENPFVIINRKNEICYPKTGEESGYLTYIDENLYQEIVCVEKKDKATEEHVYIVDASKGKRVKELDFGYCIRKDGKGSYIGSDTQIEDLEGTDDEVYYYLNRDFSISFGGKVFNMGNTFNEGLAYVELITNGDINEAPKKRKIQCGYINTDGEMVIKLDEPVLGCDFSEGRAIVYYEDHVDCIDTSGVVLYSLELKKKIKKDSDKYYLLAGSMYHDGMVAIYNGKWDGVVNYKGQWCVNPIYLDVKLYDNKLAIVEDVKYAYGILNLNGGDEDDK